MIIRIIGLTCSILLLSNEGGGSCSDNFSGSVVVFLLYFHDLKFLYYCDQNKYS